MNRQDAKLAKEEEKEQREQKQQIVKERRNSNKIL